MKYNSSRKYPYAFAGTRCSRKRNAATQYTGNKTERVNENRSTATACALDTMSDLQAEVKSVIRRTCSRRTKRNDSVLLLHADTRATLFRFQRTRSPASANSTLAGENWSASR